MSSSRYIRQGLLIMQKRILWVIAVLGIATMSLPTDTVNVQDEQPAASQPAPVQVAPQRSVQPPIPGAYLIDTIKVVIYSEEGTAFITKSDVDKPSLEGQPRTLDTLIFEQLVYEDAKKFKILPDDDEIDKHLKAVQREHNMTLDQLKSVFTSAGYTYEEGRKQFGMMSAINSMLDFKIRSRLIVPEKDVRAYYNAHPELEPASYLIQRAMVPFEPGMTKQSVWKAAMQNEPSIEALWSTPFVIHKPDLAEDKMFITELAAGDISPAQDVVGGFEMFRMKEVRPERAKPLEERYQEIANLLRKPRYESLMEEYKKSLMDNAAIVYF
jgi:hypothetical protein